MKLVVFGAAARRVVFEALAKLPEPARRLALTEAAILIINPASENGWCASGDLLVGARHVIALHVHAGLADTLGHEVAHAFRGPGPGSPDDERAAAALARTWGFAGPSADPDACAAAYREEATPVRFRLGPDDVSAACATCGSACIVIPLVVPGLRAEVGAGCARCNTFGAFYVPDGACPCGSRPAAVWAAQATDEFPAATWVCECGASISRIIISAMPEPAPASDIVIPEPDEPAAHFFLRQAAFVLTLPNGSAAWARRQLRRALDELDGDPRRADVQAALDAVARGEVSPAVEAVAHALHDGFS